MPMDDQDKTDVFELRKLVKHYIELDDFLRDPSRTTYADIRAWTDDYSPYTAQTTFTNTFPVDTLYDNMPAKRVRENLFAKIVLTYIDGKTLEAASDALNLSEEEYVLVEEMLQPIPEMRLANPSAASQYRILGAIILDAGLNELEGPQKILAEALVSHAEVCHHREHGNDNPHPFTIIMRAYLGDPHTAELRRRKIDIIHKSGIAGKWEKGPERPSVFLMPDVVKEMKRTSRPEDYFAERLKSGPA